MRSNNRFGFNAIVRPNAKIVCVYGWLWWIGSGTKRLCVEHALAHFYRWRTSLGMMVLSVYNKTC